MPRTITVRMPRLANPSPEPNNFRTRVRASYRHSEGTTRLLCDSVTKRCCLFGMALAFVWVSLKWAAFKKAGSIPAGPVDSNRRDIDRRLGREMVSKFVRAEECPLLFNACVSDKGVDHEVPACKTGSAELRRRVCEHHTHG